MSAIHQSKHKVSPLLGFGELGSSITYSICFPVNPQLRTFVVCTENFEMFHITLV